MRARLDEVWQSLRRVATKKRPKKKRVHELRVATRRAGAALELFEEFLPRRRAAWFGKQLGKMRRAAGDVRDLDVLADRLDREVSGSAGEELQQQLGKRRAAAVRPLVKIHHRLASKQRFERRAKALIRRTPKRQKRADGPAESKFGPWAGRRLERLIAEFFDAEPHPGGKRKEWHAFRIRGKALRYGLEMLPGVLPANVLSETLELLAALQDRLGAINDLATADERVRECLRHPSSDTREALDRLAEEHHARLSDERSRCEAWYFGTVQGELRKLLTRQAEESEPLPVFEIARENGNGRLWPAGL